jgi:SAM-dependent methyltransferase
VDDDATPRTPADHPAECPICGTIVPSFLPFGPRKESPDRQCPTCGSLERHRQVWLFFQAKTNLLDDKVRMLHIAPEHCLATQLRARANIDYVSADIASSAAMVQMDITNIQFPSDSFDVIYASHVLEHIPDDRKAMRELYRVLRRGGWAVLQVPVWGTTTLEDPSVTDPTERERLFGQSDHVRMYGHDGEYERRLTEAGFDVRVDPLVKELGPETARRFRLSQVQDIYFCSKPGKPRTRRRLAAGIGALGFQLSRGARRIRRRLSNRR